MKQAAYETGELDEDEHAGQRSKARRWQTRCPEVITREIADEAGNPLYPGDIVSMLACVRYDMDPDVDVPGVIMGFAIGKDGAPAVVVDAPS